MYESAFSILKFCQNSVDVATVDQHSGSDIVTCKKFVKNLSLSFD